MKTLKYFLILILFSVKLECMTHDELANHLLRGMAFNDTELVQKVIDKGNNEVLKFSLIQAASIRKIKTQILDMLLKAGADIEAKDDNNHMPLLRAIVAENIGVIKFLIKQGVNVNRRINGDSILACAINSNNVSIVKLLVENGADIFIPAFFHLLPIDYAKMRKSSEIIKYLELKRVNIMRRLRKKGVVLELYIPVTALVELVLGYLGSDFGPRKRI